MRQKRVEQNENDWRNNDRSDAGLKVETHWDQ